MTYTTITLRRSPTAVTLTDGAPAGELPRPASQPARSAAAADPAARQAQQLAELRGVCDHLSLAIQDLQQQQRNSLSELQQAAIELAVAAASALVGTALDRDQFGVDALVQQALARMQTDQPIRICLNPADRTLLTTLLGEAAEQGFGDGVSIVEDAGLTRGTCRAESPGMTLVSDWRNRLQDIQTTWLESLHESQIERRSDGATGQRFGRVPDRRETA